MEKYDITLVLGSKNRKRLLKATIESIRNNGFSGQIEIIVIDGGSNDGSCDWLAKQKDVFTIIQPNFKKKDEQGVSFLAHSWGNFMNIAFKSAKSPWIVMVSDDLILAKGALQKGYDLLVDKVNKGEKIGGGAFYFREYPRHDFYRVGLLPKGYININHGFYNKEALEDVNYIEENEFNFYCADGDLIMRLNDKGWKTIPLEDSFANHLVHKPVFKKEKLSASTMRDIEVFNSKYPYPCEINEIKKNSDISIETMPFWKSGFSNCIFGILLKIYDQYRKR
ncbi:glycosyltransferase family 2 protein [Flavobacterium sp. FlaQc-57]|uniref:glycosyltransferase family 2 protein n=1 Tax=Flavobacterium sp. FlaQc-57 TaxID=3374186 RepID=UPI003757EA36